MSEYQKVSRSELFPKDEQQTFQPESDELPSIDLEFVSVDLETNPGNTDSQVNTTMAEEFEFPLFSLSTLETAADHDDKASHGEESRGRSSNKLMTVSIREPSPDIVRQERPRSFYFAEYTSEQVSNFQKSAIEYDTVLRESTQGPYRGWARYRGRVLDVVSHNEKVSRERLREQKLKRRRPGKKQREARKAGAQRVTERLEKAKDIKKLIKKKFHKRGGKKNKKAAESAVPPTTKYRTE